MKFDNFEAVDNGFSNFVTSSTNIIGTPLSTNNVMGTTPPMYSYRNIKNCVDLYTLFQPSVGIDAAPSNNEVNVGIASRYLMINAQALTTNLVAPSTPAIPLYSPNDITILISNFKLRLRPLAIAYANNPTALNLQKLQNQINSLNIPLASKGLRFNMQVGSM
jgi:hypothetical protein